MKKYTIELAGLGAECYVFPLNEEQLTTFKNGGVDTTFSCFASPRGIVNHVRPLSIGSFEV
jgi:hypothetical protein